MTITLPTDALDAGLEKLGLAGDADLRRRLLDYVQLLAQWNQRFNLTAIRDPEAMVTGHLLDSLVVLPWLHGERLADVGSGAGLPGLVLAMARPELAVTLIDSNGKKARFLRAACRELGLPGVTVWQGRVEDYPDRAAFDTVICRAFAPLPRLLKLCAPLVADTGHLLALKGPGVDEEIGSAPAGWDAGWVYRTEELEVPGLDRQRRLVILSRTPAT